MKKITLILFILLTGCTSISNVKELDFGITGLEMEFYPINNIGVYPTLLGGMTKCWVQRGRALQFSAKIGLLL